MSEHKESEIEETKTSRKGFLSLVTKVTVIGGLLGQSAMFIRALAPNVLYEPLKRFKIGFPNKFSSGTNFLSEGRIFIVKESNQYHSISAVCTHLGCTVNLHKLAEPQKVTTLNGDEIVQKWEFHCPCHGSKYRGDGSVYAGPAPADLATYKLGLAPDGNIEVDTGEEVSKEFRATI